MLFILGVIGLCQVTFLPGLILVKVLKVKGNLVTKAVIIFGLSLFINYVLGFLLTTIRIYTQSTMIILAGLEIIAAVFVYRKELMTKTPDLLTRVWEKILHFFELVFKPNEADEKRGKAVSAVLSLFRFIFFIVAVISIGWLIRLFFQNLGTIFNTWDAVMSWNRWAVTWAGFQVSPTAADQLVDHLCSDG
jgi:uncharacterized membrane protein